MLEACTESSCISGLLDDYRSLRLVEARARWISGRGTEEIRRDDRALPLVASLVEPGLDPDRMLARIDAARRRIRSCFDAVVSAGTVGALEEPAPDAMATQ